MDIPRFGVVLVTCPQAAYDGVISVRERAIELSVICTGPEA
jgi:hypothetical protein